MSARSLSVQLHDGEAIPLDLLRGLWRLRVSMLKLNRSLEDDYAVFVNYVVGPDRCLFAFLDEHKEPKGFFTHAFMPFDMDGRASLLLYTKYYYFHRDYRGHPKATLAPWRLIPYTAKRYGVRPLHFVATAYPQSYVSLWRGSGRLYSLRDEDTPPAKRAALRAFAERFCGDDFDADEGLVRSDTVVDTEWAPRNSESEALNARYERLNPDWQSGRMLPILFSLDRRLVKTNLVRMGRRMVRG